MPYYFTQHMKLIRDGASVCITIVAGSQERDKAAALHRTLAEDIEVVLTRHADNGEIAIGKPFVPASVND